MSCGQSPYEIEITAQRQQREQALLADRSWFTLAGLHWLHPGVIHFGADPTNDLVLPRGTAPDHAGVIHFDQGETRIEAARGVVFTANGAPIETLVMQPDSTNDPTLVAIGPVTLMVIQRGQRFGIRLWDTTNPARRNFTGLRWYPINPLYRISARFTPYAAPQTLTIINVLGDEQSVASPGYVQFELHGAIQRLEAQQSGAKLFFNFRDATNGETTYQAGRFLYAATPQDNLVIMDFNRAVNPFCAYTVYGTCPLPPRQNQLAVRVEAGEMIYRSGL